MKASPDFPPQRTTGLCGRVSFVADAAGRVPPAIAEGLCT